MKHREALRIMDEGLKKPGFMVSFEHVEGSTLRPDYFPDKYAGEQLIKTEADAWVLAIKFAKSTKGKCVNIYVIDSDFSPVPDYQSNMIKNR